MASRRYRVLRNLHQTNRQQWASRSTLHALSDNGPVTTNTIESDQTVERLREVGWEWPALYQPVGRDREGCFRGFGDWCAQTICKLATLSESNVFVHQVKHRGPRTNKPTLRSYGKTNFLKPAPSNHGSSIPPTTNGTKRVLPSEEDTSAQSSKKPKPDP